MQYELTTICCTNCQTALGYSWHELNQPNHCLCEQCIDSIAYISEGLNLHDGLTTQDILYANDKQKFSTSYFVNVILNYKDKLRDAMNAKAIRAIDAKRNKTC